VSSKREYSKPKILSVELADKGAVVGGEFTPGMFYRSDLALRAEARIGHIGYSMLRTQALAATSQLGDTFGILLRGMEHTRREMRGAVSAGRFSEEEADAQFSEVGRMLHWQVILTFGVVVENLIAMLIAYDEWVSGSSDVADAFLHHGLDLIGELDRRSRRRLGYWEQVGRLPSESEVQALGCTGGEATALRAAGRKWAFKQRDDFQAVRSYYTPTMHQLYLRYKHGYSLITPRASPVRMKAGAADPLAVNHALHHGFAVVHRTHDGRTTLQIVQTDFDELSACITAGRRAVRLSRAIGNAWMFQVEHETGHTMSFDIGGGTDDAPARSALLKWVGSDLAAVYPIAEFLEDLHTSAVGAEVSEGPTAVEEGV